MVRNLQRSMGGEVTVESDERLVCSYPGRFVDALLWIAVGVFSLGLFGLVILALLSHGGVAVLAGALPGGVLVAWFGFLLRVRRRRMGVFVIDVGSRTLTHLRGKREIQKWGLEEARFETALDPFHRGWGFHYWLVARVSDGRRLRLGKGRRIDLDPVFQWLSHHGLVARP